MKESIEAFASGEIDFATYVGRTKRGWYKLAVQLLKRWQTPPELTAEDLVQIMLFEAWRRPGMYEPGRGKTLDEYVRFNACDKAKKEIHRARCAPRGDGKRESRFALCASVFGGRATPSSIDALAANNGTVWNDSRTIEEAIVQAEAVRELITDMLDRAQTQRQQFSLIALLHADGDVDDAADLLFYDVEVREHLSINTERTARNDVISAVRATI